MPDVVLSPGDTGRRALRAVGDGAAAAVTLHRVARPERFGVARLDGGRLVGFVDKPRAAPSEWVWSSAAFTPHFLRYLEQVRPAAGEWGLTEGLDAAAAVGAVSPVFIEEGWFHDVGTYEGYLAALDEVHRAAPR
jgi:glucose-1-phosphate thymidylyltransferase